MSEPARSSSPLMRFVQQWRWDDNISDFDIAIWLAGEDKRVGVTWDDKLKDAMTLMRERAECREP